MTPAATEPLAPSPELDGEIARLEAGMSARGLFDLDGAHVAILLDNFTADIRTEAPAARNAWLRLAALAHLKLRGFPPLPDDAPSGAAAASALPGSLRPPPPQDFVGASAPRDDD